MEFVCLCPHPSGFHPSFAGKRLSDGTFATRHTACYPDRLAAALAKCVSPWLSRSPTPVAFLTWRESLPLRFSWPSVVGGVEDGAGTCSPAFWQIPREQDVFKPLRHMWRSTSSPIKTLTLRTSLSLPRTSIPFSPTYGNGCMSLTLPSGRGCSKSILVNHSA